MTNCIGSCQFVRLLLALISVLNNCFDRVQKTTNVNFFNQQHKGYTQNFDKVRQLQTGKLSRDLLQKFFHFCSLNLDFQKFLIITPPMLSTLPSHLMIMIVMVTSCHSHSLATDHHQLMAWSQAPGGLSLSLSRPGLGSGLAHAQWLRVSGPHCTAQTLCH